MPHRSAKDTEPIDRELYNHKTNGDPSVLSCTQIDTEDKHPIIRREVAAAVQSLKKRRSAGVDDIPAELVHAGVEDLIIALTTICNKILLRELRRMANHMDPVLSHYTSPKKTTCSSARPTEQ